MLHNSNITTINNCNKEGFIMGFKFYNYMALPQLGGHFYQTNL